MFSPLVRHMRLVAELKRLRDQAGMTSDQLAKGAGLSRMKISRLENGVGRPNPNDIMKVLDALEIPEPRWTQLVNLANEASTQGWWTNHGDHIGARQQIYANLEYGAATVCEYHNNVIPGLLQIEAYVRGREPYWIAHDPSPAKYNLEKTLEARRVRQRMLRRTGGPRYEAVIDEVVIRRPAGPLLTMREQLLALAEMLEADDRVEIRVLALDAEIEGYWTPRAPFSLYSYAEDEDPNAVAIDNETEDLVYIDSQRVEPYRELYRRLRKASLSLDKSAELMRAAADHFALRARTKGEWA